MRKILLTVARVVVAWGNDRRQLTERVEADLADQGPQIVFGGARDLILLIALFAVATQADDAILETRMARSVGDRPLNIVRNVAVAFSLHVVAKAGKHPLRRKTAQAARACHVTVRER